MNKKYRKAVVAGNWKMNMSIAEVKPFVEELRANISKHKTCDVVVCVPFVMLSAMSKALRDTSRICIGAQDVSEYDSGAYTGDVAGSTLRELGVRYAIIGHSERREYQHEDDFKINAKVKKALECGLHPIICVGESKKQRDFGLTIAHIEYQVRAALHGVDSEEIKHCIIAYEPIWAIGTGEVATAQQAEEVCGQIRRIIKDIYCAKTGRGISILYGGSMNDENAMTLLSMQNIDGGLIGGASLKPEKLAKIIAATDQE